MSGSIVRDCERCGKSIRRPASRFGSGAVFCNQACRRLHQKESDTRSACFWPKVDRNGASLAHAPELGPCWRWLGATNNKGYGQLRIGGRSGKLWLAHRVSWLLHKGKLPREKLVLHKCDNPPCCNPDHLFLGTVASNAADMMTKKRGRFITFKGEQHKRSKLTVAAVREIRSTTIVRGVTPALARKFGVSPAAVAAVLRGDTWRHVA